jgi:DHA1 family tetracycline resistance protein-like MFS transporter
MMSRARLGTIFAIVFVDLLGFSLILPLVPFYAKDFGASDTVVGLLVASYAAAQLIGAPILGRLSDRVGRRPVLLISILGTAIGFVILGMANQLWLLFFSRILDGVTGGNISVAQAYITDITDEKNRARGLGLIGAAYGLGFILGPALGGILSTIGATLDVGTLNWSYALPAFLAALIALFNLVAVFIFLPESLTDERRADIANNPNTTFSLRNMRQAFQRPLVGPLLTTRFFTSLGFTIFTTVFPLYALKRLALQANQTAFVLAYVGVLVALVQGVAIGRLSMRFQERQLILASSALMTLALLAWALTPSLLVLLIVLIPLAFSGGVLSTVVNSALTKVVSVEEIGGILGLSAALESATRVISPTLGGVLLDILGAWAPGIVAALITAWLTIFVWRRVYPQKIAVQETS